jgi:NAD dependent epimerase/dehydratase family enzyme
MLGEVADVVTTGQRVLPRRALDLGYAFQFPTLDEALADILH